MRHPKYRKATVGPWILLGKLYTRRANCYVCGKELAGEQLVYSNRKESIVIGAESVKKFETLVKNPRRIIMKGDFVKVTLRYGKDRYGYYAGYEERFKPYIRKIGKVILVKTTWNYETRSAGPNQYYVEFPDGERKTFSDGDVVFYEYGEKNPIGTKKVLGVKNPKKDGLIAAMIALPFIPPNPKKVYRTIEKFQSKSKPGTYYTVKIDETEALSCNCPRWIFQKGGVRDCSHIRIVKTEHIGKNPVSLYQAFHGVPPSRKTKVFYEEPKEELLKVGDLSEIRYKPTSPSKHEGVEFYHKSGDTGQTVLKTNLVLATDKSGRNLYLVKKDKNVKRPYFSSRGIIG